MAAFDSSWMSGWQRAVNEDPTMAIVGRYFTADFVLGFGDHDYLVSVRNGKIEQVLDDLTIENPYTFALRGPRESWEKFIQRVPPPMYNDIWAMRTRSTGVSGWRVTSRSCGSTFGR